MYSNSTCTTAVSTGTAKTITTPGTLPVSSPVTLPTAGTYYWQASYSGDTNHASSKSTCGTSGEVETVSATTPTNLTTSLVVAGSRSCTGEWGARDDGCGPGGGHYSAKRGVHTDTTPSPHAGKAKPKSKLMAKSAGVRACGNWRGWGSGGCEAGHESAVLSVPGGTAVVDSANLSGTNASTATGTVTYTVYSNNTCTSSTGSGGTVQVSAGAIPTSNPVTMTAPGTYYWQASYSGDSANSASTSSCGSEVETVTPAPTTVSTLLLGQGVFGGGWCWWWGHALTVYAGAAVTDSSTLSGTNVASASGTVTYRVYSSHDAWGHQSVTQVASGGTVTVTNGSVPDSAPVTLSPGTYYWQASYSGDGSNAPSTSSWGSEIEVVIPVPSCTHGWSWGFDGGCRSYGKGGGSGEYGHGDGQGHDHHDTASKVRTKGRKKR